MSEAKLYQILSDDQPKGIPWEKAAAQFVKLKMASGGLIPEQIEELHALAKQAEAAKQAEPVTVSKEEIAQAMKKGILSGARSSVRGDISRSADVRRKRGEEISKNVGTLAGILGGGAAGKKLVGGKAGAIGGAALGAILGHGTGKTVGREIDRARIRAQRKGATIEKQSGILQPDQPRAKDVIPGRGPEAREARTALREKLRAGCPGQEKTSDFEADKTAQVPIPIYTDKKGRTPLGSTLAGIGLGGLAAGGGLYAAHKLGVPEHVMNYAVPATALLGVGGGASLGSYLGAQRSNKKIDEKRLAHLLEQEKMGEATKTAAVSRVRAMLMAKKASVLKRAQEEDEAIPVEYLDSMEQPGEEEALPPEIEEFMQAQQEANEAEFFRQKAEEAEDRAAQAEEQADMAAAAADQAQQQADMTAQQSEMQAQATQQQSEMAQQQSQMASQDAVNARNEALSAQQQNIQMRQAITSFRQQLMDLVAQDPTTMMPPPAVPQGPAPGMEEGAAGPPPEAGPPPGAEMPPGAPGAPPGMPPGAEGAMPPPGAEMAPPGPPAPPQGPPGMPPGMPPGPPAGPPVTPPMG